MAKLSSKISFPIILAGAFAITIFIALDYDRLDLNFYVVLLLLTMFVFFFGFATGQSLSSPVRQLLESAKDLKDGNFSSRVYLETKDELSDLAKVLNQIAEEMELTKAQKDDAQKSVDVKVRARTQELKEIIQALEQKVKNRTIEHEKLVLEQKKIQQETKDKESEMVRLRKELSEIKSKVGKFSKENNLENNNSVEG
jgi:nitrate/nitrite-specific signal transduction histidine kinase